MSLTYFNFFNTCNKNKLDIIKHNKNEMTTFLL